MPLGYEKSPRLMSQPLSLWESEHDKIPRLFPDLKHFSRIPRLSSTVKLETHFPGFPGWLRKIVVCCPCVTDILFHITALAIMRYF